MTKVNLPEKASAQANLSAILTALHIKAVPNTPALAQIVADRANAELELIWKEKPIKTDRDWVLWAAQLPVEAQTPASAGTGTGDAKSDKR